MFYRNFVYTLQSTFAGCLRPKKGEEIWERVKTTNMYTEEVDHLKKAEREREREFVGIAFPFTSVEDARAYRTMDMMDRMVLSNTPLC